MKFIVLKPKALILVLTLFATSNANRAFTIGDYCFDEACPCESINGTIIDGWCLPSNTQTCDT